RDLHPTQKGIDAGTSAKIAAEKQAAAERFRWLQRRFCKAVAKIGEAVSTEINRPQEHVYRPPENQITIKTGQKFDITTLDPSKKYLYIINEAGDAVLAPESQPGYKYSSGPRAGQPRVLKHRDLAPGPGGKTPGKARIGGEFYFSESEGTWIVDNSSSFSALRATRPGAPSDLPPSPKESLDATLEIFELTGSDVSKIQTRDVIRRNQ
ncbi:MAG: hypothetical protein R3B72_11370, partial [Polyangiaceae bacterium]